MAHIHQGLGAVHEYRQKLYHPYLLALLAEAYGQAGQPEAGLHCLAEALTLVAATEERLVGGRGVSAQGGVAAPTPASQISARRKTCLHQALDVARRQQAKALELRAALSLGRLWQQQGKRDQAQTVTDARSIAGSPKGLRRLTCKRPRPC